MLHADTRGRPLRCQNTQTSEFLLIWVGRIAQPVAKKIEG